ncbi:hypothetical protein [Apilactobacillus ozensis]|uniref:hypothetical protein n=1 Tax=Apilactobacillus ozensis TaxID=866801 RepID=UPI000A7F8F48|nr:hypothetical protein [Apilactobacillus ozensis]
MMMIFLILLFSDTQPRRPKLIENLLAGKKTVSTLFWGMRYELINYCELFSNYKNFNIINNLKLLIDKKYLKKTIDGEHLLLTSAGKEQQNDILNNYYLPRHSEIYHKYNILRFKKRFY